MNQNDILKIETTLNVKLPSEFIDFITSERNYDAIDEVTVMDDANNIIEATTEYREGKFNQNWPNHLLYIGDEADASPYALDCQTGILNRLDKGSLVKKPLESFKSFRVFVKHKHKEYQQELTLKKSEIKYKFISDLTFYLPAFIGFLLFFVVMPIIAYSIRQLYLWIIG